MDTTWIGALGLAAATVVFSGCDDGGWSPDDGGAADDGEDGQEEDTFGDSGEPSGNCGSGHPAVGSTALLDENFHDVGGMAEIIDDCTIEIRDFTFDGQGIDVQIYAGLGGNYDDGFSISDSLELGSAYDGETLTLKLPSNRSVDDLDGISVWCVPVGVDFGSGRFEAVTTPD